MARIILILMMVGLLGCETAPRIRSEVQEVYIPLLYCPAPPEFTRPVLPIHNMTEEQLMSDGELVKHYKATVKALEGYSVELETIIRQYDKSNDAYDELRQKFEQNWQEEFGEGIEIRPE